MKNPPWSRDEHIIALDFYLKHNPIIPGKDSKEVIQLSELLNNGVCQPTCRVTSCCLL